MNADWFEMVAYSGLGWRTSKEATYDIAMLALQHGIPGDFVECGVYAGASVALMAMALIDYARPSGAIPLLSAITRRVHLFDSFQGTPAPGPEDLPAVLPEGGARCPIEGVKENMAGWGIPEELLIYHPGWFADTVSWAEGYMPRIAVLRLDGDLYSSTRICLQHLLPLVSPGGWVIVDDFDLPGCRNAIARPLPIDVTPKRVNEALDGILSPAPIYFRIPERV